VEKSRQEAMLVHKNIENRASLCCAKAVESLLIAVWMNAPPQDSGFFQPVPVKSWDARAGGPGRS
jgi:hypothetical protein